MKERIDSHDRAGGQISPERELLTGDGYRWFVYSERDTGLRLICLEDLTTGIVVATTVANPDKRVAAHRAWAGARHSRAPGEIQEIMQEMGERGVDPDAKLEGVFANYGHLSVGDMARMGIDIGRVPMHLCMGLFNLTAVNSGQEKSSRFQSRFGQVLLHPLENYLTDGIIDGDSDIRQRYQLFGAQSLELFAKHQAKLTEAFKGFYQPANQNQNRSLDSRVLDCVRYFLLFGQNSGMSFETSARDWSRMIGELKASPIAVYRRFATQIERLLVPTNEEEGQLGYLAQAPGLIRHAELSPIVNDNLSTLQRFATDQTSLLTQVMIRRNVFMGRVDQKVELLSKDYSQGERLAAQYFLTVWPGLDRQQLLDWLHNQSVEIKKKISGIIFSGHDNYHELPIWAGVTSQTLAVKGFLGELRDFNRHRGWRRFIPMPLVFGQPWTLDTAQQVIANGFGLPLYLSQIDEFKGLAQNFEDDLKDYYRSLYSFIRQMQLHYGDHIDYSFVINLLPLAHQVDLWMHGDPKQGLYLTHQRTRPGGHINYRRLAFDANQLITESDPYLSGIRLDKCPDPRSRKEFFDRS